MNVFERLIKLFIVTILICGSVQAATVKIIPIQGVIDVGLARFIDREVQAVAEDPEIEAIIFNINTPGGRVDAAGEIIDTILNSPKLTIAFIDKEAISAGAMIAIACRKIYMVPGSTIGDVEPKPTDEKAVSYVKARMRAAAERNGRDPRITDAMVDKSLGLNGVTPTGSLVTLTVQEALKLKIADGQVLDFEALLKTLNLENATIVTAHISFSETIVRWLTHPITSSMLLTVGFLGIFFALQLGSFGFSGMIGLAALALFFGGHLFAGLAGLEVLVLFMFGLILLALEIMVIPGFGLLGLSGIGVMGLSLYLVFQDWNIFVTVISPAVLVGVVAFVAFLFTLQDSWLMKKFALNKSLDKQDDFVAFDNENTHLIGSQGIAHTTLRPAGTILINDKKYDAIANGEYIEKGSVVEVINIEGGAIHCKAI